MRNYGDIYMLFGLLVWLIDEKPLPCFCILCIWLIRQLSRTGLGMVGLQLLSFSPLLCIQCTIIATPNYV